MTLKSYSWAFTQRYEDISLHTKLADECHSSIIYNTQTQKQLKYPSLNIRKNKQIVAYHLVEFYSKIKRNEQQIHAMTWIYLKK